MGPPNAKAPSDGPTHELVGCPMRFRGGNPPSDGLAHQARTGVEMRWTGAASREVDRSGESWIGLVWASFAASIREAAGSLAAGSSDGLGEGGELGLPGRGVGVGEGVDG